MNGRKQLPRIPFLPQNAGRILLYFCAASSLFALLGGVLYAWLNRSGHTGIEFAWGYLFFGLVLGFGRGFRRLSRGRSQLARVTELFGILGILWIIFVTQLNILNEYSAWIEKGMPERNPFADVLLLAFVVVAGGLFLLSNRLTKKANRSALRAPNPSS